LRYISPKAKLTLREVFLEGDLMILGPTLVGAGTRLGFNTLIGYPSRAKLRGLKPSASEHPVSLDRVSSGSEIGERCVIRSSTTIYEGTVLSDGVSTGHGVLIREDSRVGERTSIGTGAQLDGTVVIGRGSNIQSMVYLPHLTFVGDNVFMGPNAVVTNDKYPASRRLLGVRIGDGCVIGANATLMAGVEVGDGAVVAAGSVVTRKVEPRTVVLGVPARLYCGREEYEEKKARYEGEAAKP